ncbi:peptide MFS transporter [Phenylobacterium sp.]|uniref:peptide MFS transporter n=1 Tax=Phenylobacterium sp. TaxID=1871053 RepID=UPI0011F4CDF8|nr:peptide MFS transporter [Phenylobacterium sp.]THD65029.1 MAG: MFS transporter [Phenylobacterium sp.]
MALAETEIPLAPEAAPPAAGDRGFAGHPPGLAYLSFMEAFERFSFYGMQALLVLYMTSQLLTPGHVEHVAGFGAFHALLQTVFGPMSPQATASEVFGLYAGLCSLTPVFGGLIGDQVLGQKRSVLVGGTMMAAGHFLMAFEGPFLLALALLILGCGLLKGNISAQVGNLYRGADRRRADAFQLFYMAANVGVFSAPLVCGTLGEVVGWHWGFGAAGVGMLISLGIYLAGYSRLPPDTLPPKGAPRRAEAARLTAQDLPVLAAMGVLLAVIALFWIANGEVLNAYMIWARSHLDRRIGGFVLPITWLQSVSAIVGITLAPVLIGLWSVQARRGAEPSALGKMATGCGLAVSAYALLALACAVSGPTKVALVWVLGFHLMIQTAYLFVYPIGMALFSRAAPPAINSLMIGVYFLSVFAGSLLVGWVGQFYERMRPEAFWLLHCAAAGLGGLIILALWKPLSRAFVVKII